MMKRIFLVLAFLCAAHSDAGMLPQLDDRPWTGHFAGYEKRGFRAWVDREGVCYVCQADGRGGYVMNRAGVQIEPVIEEMRADGTGSFRKRLQDGWEALTPAAAPAEKVAYRGTVTGGARFEVHVEFDGVEIRAGGRLIEAGTLKNPRFTLRVTLPNAYFHERDPAKLAQRAKKDRVDLERVDGKKLRLDVLSDVNAASDEHNGPGISRARVDMDGYRGARFELAAPAGSRFDFRNSGAAPLYRGFTMGWRADEGKDPEGKLRFSLMVR